MSEKLRAKIAEQRAYIDLLVKAGKGSEDYAERVLGGVRAEIARTDSDLSLAYRLEGFLATVGDPQPTNETYTRERLEDVAAGLALKAGEKRSEAEGNFGDERDVPEGEANAYHDAATTLLAALDTIEGKGGEDG